MQRLTMAFAMLGIGLSVNASAASYDCAKASSRIDNAICASSQVSKLDEELASTYSAARATSNDPEGVTQAQRDWLKQTRNQCQDEACLITVYQQRIAALSPKAIGPAAGALPSQGAGQASAAEAASPAAAQVDATLPTKQEAPASSSSVVQTTPVDSAVAAPSAAAQDSKVTAREQSVGQASGSNDDAVNGIIGLIIIASAIWVYVDAKGRGIRRRGTGKLVDIGPVGWGVCVLLLWIVAFPLYLLNRSKLAAGPSLSIDNEGDDGRNARRTPNRVIGLLKWVGIALVGLFVIGYLAGGDKKDGSLSAPLSSQQGSVSSTAARDSEGGSDSSDWYIIGGAVNERSVLGLETTVVCTPEADGPAKMLDTLQRAGIQHETRNEEKSGGQVVRVQIVSSAGRVDFVRGKKRCEGIAAALQKQVSGEEKRRADGLNKYK